MTEAHLNKPTVRKPMATPSMDEAKLHGAKIGLPENQVELWWWHYESNGWVVGKTRMVSWPGAMAGWKLRWQERQAEKQQRVDQPSRNVMLIQWRHELDRVEKRMGSIRGSYSEHQSWSQTDKDLFNKMKARKLELVKELGMVI